MTTMRAKLQVSMVQEHRYGEGGAKSGETLTMHAVCENGYDDTGLDEDNTFAKFSPGASFVIQIANPALGQVQPRRQVLRGFHAGR